MAINPAGQYPGQITPASTEYPYGSARDVSSPGAGDGTPLQQAWVNDWFGFQQKVMNAAGITPSGNPDSATESDVFNGLIGRLLNVQTFTASGTYTPTSGAKKIVVEIIGAGGGSGGLGGTGTNQVVISAGGGSGTYAKVLITDPVQTVVTVGTGGAGGLGQSGATGGRGGSSIFGSFVTAEGGYGSQVGLSKERPAHGIPAAGAPAYSFNNCTLLSFGYGGAGSPGFISPNGDAIAGAGAASFFGLGGDGNGSQSAGIPGTSPGSGGGGVCVNVSSYGTTTVGAAGAGGICVVWEYS